MLFFLCVRFGEGGVGGACRWAFWGGGSRWGVRVGVFVRFIRLGKEVP